MAFTEQDLKRLGLVEVLPGRYEKRGHIQFLTAEEIEIKKTNKFHAIKVEADGVVYDSKREYGFKKLLDHYGIHYEMKRKYILQEGFVYGKEKIRPIAIIPDFTILKKDAVLYKNEAFAIVDIKGMIMTDFKLKVKMLKKILINQQQRAVPVFMPRNKKEVEITIQELLKIIN